MIWRCFIPGKQGTDWDGGFYPLTMEFSEDYPSKPPKCKFPAGFFHPNGEAPAVRRSGGAAFSLSRRPPRTPPRKKNHQTQPTTHNQNPTKQPQPPPKKTPNPPLVYPSGTVCLSILNEDSGWKPSLTVSQVLSGVQELLDDPNPHSPAQSEAYVSFTQRRAEYTRLVREQARRYPPPS